MWAALPQGVVTGWAALRLYGGGFFDGRGPTGDPLPVPVLVEHRVHPRHLPGRLLLRTRSMPPRVIRHGLPCAPPARAAIDAARLAPSQRDAVIALDMAAAAGVASLHQVQVAVGELKFATGLGRVRWALGHASEASRSPMETWLRLIWTLDAGCPQPLVNVPVWNQDGRLIGLPDLFDPEAGVAGEYDGAFHRERWRHRRDVSRTEAFRAAGIETFTMVAGDSPETAISRMRSARDRALWLPPGQRRWSLSPPGRQPNS